MRAVRMDEVESIKMGVAMLLSKQRVDEETRDDHHVCLDHPHHYFSLIPLSSFQCHIVLDTQVVHQSGF